MIRYIMFFCPVNMGDTAMASNLRYYLQNNGIIQHP